MWCVLQMGMDPRAKDTDGRDAFWYAKGDKDVVEALKAAGPNKKKAKAANKDEEEGQQQEEEKKKKRGEDPLLCT